MKLPPWIELRRRDTDWLIVWRNVIVLLALGLSVVLAALLWREAGK